MASVSKAEMYMFDEPSSYLDVKQRLTAAKVIRKLLTDNTYLICVEHDLSILDYLSDFICVLYGEPSAYGIVTTPFTVREGINIFLAGFVPNENMRFREYELTFKVFLPLININRLSTTKRLWKIRKYATMIIQHSRKN
jgi:ATP-binding cassette subfamily E protein 1